MKNIAEPSSNTKYGVYIIEFLRADDYCDGEALHAILELSLIPTKYEWADSIDDLKRFLIDFNNLEYRYLHISCHADATGFEINGDKISNFKIQSLTKNIISNKRLFLSACKGANKDLASRIIVGNNAYSLLGIPINLYFDKSALFWPSFYHLINEIDSKKMSRENIIDIVKKCVNLFKIPVNYYSRINNSKTHLRRLKIRHENIENMKIKSTI
jgi:hypothetical protein